MFISYYKKTLIEESRIRIRERGSFAVSNHEIFRNILNFSTFRFSPWRFKVSCECLTFIFFIWVQVHILPTSSQKSCFIFRKRVWLVLFFFCSILRILRSKSRNYFWFQISTIYDWFFFLPVSNFERFGVKILIDYVWKLW